jgi:hypothetical protein
MAQAHPRTTDWHVQTSNWRCTPFQMRMKCPCVQSRQAFTPKVVDAAGLFVLRSLPDEAMAEIRRHLSRLDWDCFRAACRLPLYKGVGPEDFLDLEISERARQERALLSDPLARELFVALWIKRSERKVLQKLGNMTNLKYLSLRECGLGRPIRCALPSVKHLSFCLCTLDAAGCPAIPTLTSLRVEQCRVLLSGAGHPFPLVSREAHSLEVLNLYR